MMASNLIHSAWCLKANAFVIVGAELQNAADKLKQLKCDESWFIEITPTMKRLDTWQALLVGYGSAAYFLLESDHAFCPWNFACAGAGGSAWWQSFALDAVHETALPIW